MNDVSGLDPSDALESKLMKKSLSLEEGQKGDNYFTSLINMQMSLIVWMYLSK